METESKAWSTSDEIAFLSEIDDGIGYRGNGQIILSWARQDKFFEGYVKAFESRDWTGMDKEAIRAWLVEHGRM